MVAMWCEGKGKTLPKSTMSHKAITVSKMMSVLVSRDKLDNAQQTKSSKRDKGFF